MRGHPVLTRPSLPRLCCQTMGWAPGWESWTPQRNPSPYKHLFRLTNCGWATSILTPLTTSGWRVSVARAPHPGPTGFLWRHRREVRRGWWPGDVAHCPTDPCTHQYDPGISSRPFNPCGFRLLPASSPTPQHGTLASLPCASAHGRPARGAHVHALCTLALLPGNRGGGQEEVGMPASPPPCPPVPLGPPENVSAMRNGSQALVHWQEPRAPLQGTLLGYRLAYRGQDTPEVGAAG